MKIAAMRRWFSDTLFKRLFFLMWAALVVSHLAAFTVSTGWLWSDRQTPARLPTFPSLPPGALPDRGPGPSMPPFGEHRGPRDMAPPGEPRGPFEPGVEPRGDAPPAGGRPPVRDRLLLVDYGVRLLLIGMAAWWGARWLSAPMRRLVHASRELGRTLGRQGATLPRLDEHRGTVEVRETAHVFNEMAQQLDESFRHRGLLMAAISHDLRTPLTRMRMRLENLADDARVQRCIADIAEMDQLIDSALEVFRNAGTSEPMQATDITALVQSLADDLIEQGQPVTFAGETAAAPAQPMALRRVVSNLLSNALRYGERATVAVQADAQHVSITIDDEGPGIPPHELEAVFAPFHRVESSRNRNTGGTGLGLYIARDLAARQGASLSLRNRETGGLRAEIRLPR